MNNTLVINQKSDFKNDNCYKTIYDNINNKVFRPIYHLIRKEIHHRTPYMIESKDGYLSMDSLVYTLLLLNRSDEGFVKEDIKDVYTNLIPVLVAHERLFTEGLPGNILWCYATQNLLSSLPTNFVASLVVKITNHINNLKASLISETGNNVNSNKAESKRNNPIKKTSLRHECQRLSTILTEIQILYQDIEGVIPSLNRLQYLNILKRIDKADMDFLFKSLRDVHTSTVKENSSYHQVISATLQELGLRISM